MDTRLLKRLRAEARKAYGVEKRDNKEYVLMTYTRMDKCAMREFNTFEVARHFCDLERANFVYCMALKMRAAKVRVKRVY